MKITVNGTTFYETQEAALAACQDLLANGGRAVALYSASQGWYLFELGDRSRRENFINYGPYENANLTDVMGI